jgi:hypothetical protein
MYGTNGLAEEGGQLTAKTVPDYYGLDGPTPEHGHG